MLGKIGNARIIQIPEPKRQKKRQRSVEIEEKKNVMQKTLDLMDNQGEEIMILVVIN